MSITIQWLGQAGFLIRMSNGKTIGIDPYLGDSCMRRFGFRRMTLAPMDISQFHVDYLFISHQHADHLDIDLYESLQRRNDIQIYGNAPCVDVLKKFDLDSSRLQIMNIGDQLDFDGFSLQVIPADHGDGCPGALGFLFDFSGTSVYFAGDTAYNPELLKDACRTQPQIALLPINGAYGNLNSEEAAKLAVDIGCRMVIPCHFWMFVEHGSDPLEFSRKMEELAPQVQTRFMGVGEELEIGN